jgi:hypothetical protein
MYILVGTANEKIEKLIKTSVQFGSDSDADLAKGLWRFTQNFLRL